MKREVILIVFLIFSSCGEKLIEKPENLIPKDKMVEIITEVAILKAAKGNNKHLMEDIGVTQTEYIFKKFNIDSTQFAESDTYYVSIPAQYEEIYTKVEALLTEKGEQTEKLRRTQDSLRLLLGGEEKMERPSKLPQ